MIALIIHGGCHELPPSESEMLMAQAGIKKYGEKGFSMLKEGKSALDVAEAVISMLEDDPAFDAGTGSFKNLNGEAEMDAIIMDSSFRCGGVQCIQNVKNPISVARLVMEKTPHILLSGKGAEQFARTHGIPVCEPAEEDVALQETGDRKRLLGDVQYYTEFRSGDKVFSTVGITLVDSKGDLVAATSTGGIRMKMPGRVGDSAMPGAGTFCNEEIALSATGEGEGIMRLCLTHRIAMEYRHNKDLTGVCKNGIAEGSAIDCVCGVIALNRFGKFTWAHNGAFMPVYHNSCT